MGLSRSARITILLVIDIAFFFLELIVGYAVGSLALVADSFHMLNADSDVMSLIVALYAIKLTEKTSNERYTYGWHRAEILAALVNGVFLVALCFSIALEAFGRFLSTPEVSNPKLVVVVGILGLASNIVGLFLFHEHGHSHGHSHGPSPSTSRGSSASPSITEQNGVTPSKKIPERRRSHSDTLYGHPVATRASLVQAANEIASARSPSPTRVLRSPSCNTPRVTNMSDVFEDEEPANILENGERTPLLADTPNRNQKDHDHDPSHSCSHPHSASEGGHSPGQAQAHGSMNMRALILHVLGDALGNVGVIATGLVIWKSDWVYKFYFDPVISLVITVIIFSSALPLVRSASFILLQGVPPTVSIEAVRQSILAIDGVHDLHDLHVWQLSETKIIASVHVTTSRSYDFMPVATNIRKALHDHGIHSSTIQPEYFNPGNTPRIDSSFRTSSESNCLILCPQDAGCDPKADSCCPPPAIDV